MNLASFAREIERIWTAFRRLEARVPLRLPVGGAGAATDRAVRIIGGNELAGGGHSIQYAETTPTATQAYDPDSDTVYPVGVGYGWLFIDGVRQPDRVLIRHDFYGDQSPALAGRVCAVAGTETWIYDEGGPSEASMTLYRISWL